MEILDPDLWNDDGTPKRPTRQYMDSLEVAQAIEAVESTQREAYLNYARVKQAAKTARSPEVGDIVHAWNEADVVCYAAIVMETESFNDSAEIRVHIPHKPFEDWHAVHEEVKEGAGEGTWHWPCGEGQ